MVILCEASASIPLIHNVARNMKQHIPNPLHMPRTCADGPNLREVGMSKRQPNRSPPGTLIGERMQCCVGPRHSVPVCVGPRRSVSLVLEPGAFCVGARRCVVVSLSVFCPGTLCVGLRRSAGALCRGPLLKSAWHLVHRPQLRSASA